MSQSSELLTFTVPLPVDAHQQAERLRLQQSNLRKKKQVYLNTLAVYAVNAYLKAMGIQTDLNSSYSQDLTWIALFEVADLMIQGYGRVDCRPVLPGEDLVHILPETWDDQIGVIAVRLDEELRQATLIGFLPAALEVDVPLRGFNPLSDLLIHLEMLRQQEHAAQLILNQIAQRVTDLNAWVEGVWEAGWQSIQNLRQPHLKYAFRNTVSSSTEQFAAGKLFNLSMQVTNHPLLLLVGVTPVENDKKRVLVRLCSASQEHPLAANLSIELISQSGQILNCVREQVETDYLQLLPFKVQSGNRFAIQITYGESSITETFVA